MDLDQRPWPTELRLIDGGRCLRVTFGDGARFDLPAELLRVSSPSAEVQGHGPGERKTVPGKRAVAIVAVEPVGNYAAKLSFSDGHATGLFTWAYLHDLGTRAETVWADYLAALEAKGLSRG